MGGWRSQQHQREKKNLERERGRDTRREREKERKSEREMSEEEKAAKWPAGVSLVIIAERDREKSGESKGA